MIETRHLDRVEVAILRALFECDAPVDLRMLHEIADPREKLGLSLSALKAALDLLQRDCLVKRTGGILADSRWQISNRGSAKLIAREAAGVFKKSPADEPIQVTVCNAQEPQPEQARPMSSALICLDEDELDEWWQGLDVECKADAFAGFALRVHTGDSYVAIDRPADRVPVLGTVGEGSAGELQREEAQQ